jgi:hypothetical protein
MANHTQIGDFVAANGDKAGDNDGTSALALSAERREY